MHPVLSRRSFRTTCALLSFGAVFGCSPEKEQEQESGPDGGDGGTSSGGVSLGAGGDAPLGGGGLPSGGTGGEGAGGTSFETGGSVATGGDEGVSSGGSTPASGGTLGSGGTDLGTGGSNEDPTCEQGLWDGTTPEVLTLSGSTFAHDPTMIKADGVYYRFWTGNHIQRATSNNLTNWSNASTVYGGSYPSWVNPWLAGVSGQTFNFPWAPDVSYFGGQYHIYSTFSAKFGDNISCISHLTTSDLASNNFTDHGPVICTEGNENYNAIDADVGITQDGTPWLSFGSFWGGIYSFELNQDGSRKDENSDLTHLAWASQIEAPVLFYRCGYYYLFVTFGLCCPGEGRTVDQLTYRVAMGRSTSITGPFIDKNGANLTEGGGTLLVQGDGINWAAAGHSDVLFDDDKIYHLYHAYRKSDGGAQLRIVELPFDDEGWPVPGGP